jgi:hypothetical protein
VSGLFVASGSLSALKTLLQFVATGSFAPHFGIIELWIGAGLLRYDPKSLKWAKRFIWFDLFFIDIAALFNTFGSSAPKLNLGPWSWRMSGAAAVAYLFVLAVKSLWQLHVLKRPEIEELFEERVWRTRNPTTGKTFADELAAPATVHDKARAKAVKAAAIPVSIEPTANSSIPLHDIR